MLTQVPIAAAKYAPSHPDDRPDDISGHRHRQAIGYLGLALPILLTQAVRIRPNPVSDQWIGDSISAYYWTGAVSLFSGLLAALSLFLLTYRGYANKYKKWDRRAAIFAGSAAAVVALFPTSPPGGMAPPPWWAAWISKAHVIGAVSLFSMFAIFSLVLFRLTAPERQATKTKWGWPNWFYATCGLVIVGSMIWAFVTRRSNGSIYWPESVALVAFASSWLVKGRFIRSITSTAQAAASAATRKLSP